ncbi:hypothetical protein [Labilibacter marinus]|uniref:hypothetical protein n=1 Tax=Labilibacter marinus TaxID=1477105 RepID=UPI00094F7EE9|nr:hypothetical protein [Labilibacter marinus]
MKEENNILNSIKKQAPSAGFKVPDNYFDSFEDKMMDKIIAEEKSTPKKSILIMMKPWLSLAAMMIFIAMAYYSIPYFTAKNTNLAYNTEEVSLDFLASRLNETDIIDFIVEEDNSPIFEELETNQNILEGLSIEDVESLVIF